MTSFVQKYAKGCVAFAGGVIGAAIAQGLLSGATAAWAAIIIGALTTAGVVATPNKPAE